MADREGMIIPNTSQVGADYQVAQVDKGDVLTLGNQRYGVVSGCKCTIVGNNVHVTGSNHSVVVDGQFFPDIAVPDLAISSLPVGVYGRFDSVVYDASDVGFKLVQGTAGDNPVFPDLTDTMVLLAVVFVTGTGKRITDKRVMLTTGMFVAGSEEPLIQSTNDTGLDTSYQLDADGTSTWSNGAVLETGSSDDELVVRDYLTSKHIHAGPTGGSLKLNGKDVATQEYVDNSFSLSSVPTGTIIPSMDPNLDYSLSGEMWLRLDGATRTSGVVGDEGDDLRAILGLSAGATFTLPDMTGYVPFLPTLAADYDPTLLLTSPSFDIYWYVKM